ncbi:transporter, UIT6 family [Ekhidna lutea]|uniref:Transporter, UIT6 family n=1 Tax=Ekhidna lutea TaxID=447679 RepID=A0A239IEU2_EKHLU|nr:sodium:proton antiporter [Ekhidna lutea]SNS92160.1 transporter, UIT6 family [Ekhidna lutea]
MIRRVFVALIFVCTLSFAFANDSAPIQEQQETHQTMDHDVEGGHASEKPKMWSVAPFVILLLMIATGPLFYPHFWHKSYPVISVILAIIVCTYYLFYLHNVHAPIHSGAEYVQFIALLAGLFVASGGILINVDKDAHPLTNVIILAIGAVIANIIGTTGASMLLIRPFIRLNKNRIKPYHIVFFIFIVSNVGGSLTPIGDPPLFLGFLKGIPFQWTLIHNLVPWVIACIILLVFFYLFDIRNKTNYALMRGEEDELEEPTGKVSLVGKRNFIWLAIVVGAVFLDPNVFDWVPGIVYEGQKFSYIREIIMLLAAFGSFKYADLQAIQGNEFSFEPIREVAFLFIGIFFTMMPALELVSDFAQSPEGEKLIRPSTLYWGTGLLSGFLDNAPTYVNFLTASMASVGADVNNIQEVIAYANDEYKSSLLSLMAISLGAVFFGAFTYIGNGPNFMVKSIAEQVGIKMPSFFSYIVKYSIPILLPVLIIIWLIFFMGH